MFACSKRRVRDRRKGMLNELVLRRMQRGDRVVPGLVASRTYIDIQLSQQLVLRTGIDSNFIRPRAVTLTAITRYYSL